MFGIFFVALRHMARSQAAPQQLKQASLRSTCTDFVTQIKTDRLCALLRLYQDIRQVHSQRHLYHKRQEGGSPLTLCPSLLGVGIHLKYENVYN